VEGRRIYFFKVLKPELIKIDPWRDSVFTFSRNRRKSCLFNIKSVNDHIVKLALISADVLDSHSVT